jgi:hypothetical protein
LIEVAVLTIVATSGLLLLEPSTEVLAGAFLNLFAVTIRWHRQAILQGILLAVFSLVKVELLPIGVAVAAFWAFASGYPAKSRLAFMVAFVMCVAAFIAPAIYLYGSEGLLSGRAFESFTTGYCFLFNAGASGQNCVQVDMPGANSMRDVVLGHTEDYLAFLAIATMQSLKNIFFTLNLLAFSPLLMFRLAFASMQSDDQNLARITLLAVLLTFAVTIPFVFLFPRYLTKLLGLLLVAGFLGLREATAARRWPLIAVTLFIVGGNLWHFTDAALHFAW